MDEYIAIWEDKKKWKFVKHTERFYIKHFFWKFPKSDHHNLLHYYWNSYFFGDHQQ